MKKILIAEDNQYLRSMLKALLEHDGFSVDVADSGYSLLGYLKDKKRPDVVILDLMLPQKSGLELLSSLKSIWPETKIFVFSAYPRYKEKIRDYVCEFFSKSEGADKLINAIREQFK